MAAPLPDLFRSIDQSSSRNFRDLDIWERVLDTGDRTISIDQIATISIEVSGRRKWRWLAWAVAAYCGYQTVHNFSQAMEVMRYPAMAGPALAVAVVFGAVTTGLVLLGLWLQDITYLQIGASDGSRTIFRSKNRAFLLEVKTFLLKKINEKNTSATNHFHFGDNVAGDKVTGTKTVNNTSTTIEGSGNQVIANAHGAAISASPNVFQASNSPGAQIGLGHSSNGSTNTLQVTHVDYSSVLSQVEQMARFYAQNPNARHVEERLSELEFLMRSGTPTAEGRSRVRRLAVDLSSILQGYPAMVQFFESVIRLAGV